MHVKDVRGAHRRHTLTKEATDGLRARAQRSLANFTKHIPNLFPPSRILFLIANHVLEFPYGTSLVEKELNCWFMGVPLSFLLLGTKEKGNWLFLYHGKMFLTMGTAKTIMET